MKIQFLGTAAAERIPALFCACDTCRRALEAGGRNIMKRSQVLINDDLLIDFSADTYANFINLGKTLCDIEYLLITHAHEDHFTFEEFFSRFVGVAYNIRAEKLKVFLSSVSYDIMQRCITARDFDRKSIDKRFEFIIVEPYSSLSVGNYTVTVLPAVHASEGEALLYLIEENGRSFFYGTDTGFFDEGIDDFLARENKIIDLLCLDCTKCDNEFNYYVHMSMSEGRKIADRFSERGLLKEGALLYYTHFSHNGRMIYDEIAVAARNKYGFHTAYDGLTVTI